MNFRDKRIVFYLLYCVVVVALIVGIVLIFRPSHTDTGTTTHHTTTAHNAAGSTAGKAGNTKIASNGKSSTTATKSGTAATSLNNSGPGNVFGVFAVASILGAWLRRRQLMRRV